MPNTIDPEELICARCGESRRPKFGNSRADTEIELTPVEGLQPAYYCSTCKRMSDSDANSNEIMRQQAIFQQVNRFKNLTGSYSDELLDSRIKNIFKRTTT